jgi:DNA-binding transcriptional MerR regulator
VSCGSEICDVLGRGRDVGRDEPEVSVQDTPDDTSAAVPAIGYSGTQTAKVVGISYRQLDYWARTDLIRPSLSDATGSGSRRSYSYNDLLELKTIKKLLDAGIKLEQVRKVFDNLREHGGSDIAAAHIVIDGGSVTLCNQGELIDLINTGQSVLNVLSMGGVKTELEADLAPTDTEMPAAVGAARKIG